MSQVVEVLAILSAANVAMLALRPRLKQFAPGLLDFVGHCIPQIVMSETASENIAPAMKNI